MTTESTAGANGRPEERKIVTFSLGRRMFAIEMKALIEIREWDEPTPLPGVPSYVKGVTNLRGTVLPVVGLAERMGWTPSVIHARSCILVVDIAGKQAGFLVDEVADIVSISKSDIKPAPDVEAGELRVIAGLVQVNGRTSDGGQGESAGAGAGGTMVSLIDLSALSLTRSLDLAA
jgi:purine-binding chemotaxis protein CheW